MTTATTPPPWAHQSEALAFAAERSGTLLHMAMGTGKSRVVVDLACAMGATRVLIICPLSVVPAWGKQFATFGGPEWSWALLGVRIAFCGATSAVAKGRGKATVKKKAAALADLEGNSNPSAPRAVIVNYDSARVGDLRKRLLRDRWDLVVFDESHKLKAPFGATQKFATKLAKKAPRVLMLTGTPMPHSPLDIFPQARILDPRAFGYSFVTFRARYAQMGGFQGHEVVGFQNTGEMREKIATFTYQCGQDVLDLPGVEPHIVVPIDLSVEATRIYADLEKHLVASVRSGEVTAANAMVKLLRLQQITGGYAAVEGDDGATTPLRVDTSKRDALRDILDGLDAGEPVVVFARFTHDLDAIHEAAAALGGSRELSGLRKELEEWQDGAARVLAVQIQAGGVGVDLTRARICVYYSIGFSLGDYEQSLARTDRPGQTRKVRYYHLVAQRTVDSHVYGALRNKKRVVESVIANLHGQ